METLVGCGVAGHDESCLCDVHIKEPVTMLSTDNFVRDMRYGPTVVEMFGFSTPWTSNSILDYFEKLCFAHDALSKEFIPNVLELNEMSMSDRWKQIRDAVREGLEFKPFNGIEVVLTRLGLSVGQFLEAVCVNKFECSKPFSMDSLKEFERMAMEPDRNLTEMTRYFGIGSVAITRTLVEYWDPVKFTGKSPKETARELMLELSLQGLFPREIIPIVYERTGIKYSKSAITHAKRRCQMVNDDDKVVE